MYPCRVAKHGSVTLRRLPFKAALITEMIQIDYLMQKQNANVKRRRRDGHAANRALGTQPFLQSCGVSHSIISLPDSNSHNNIITYL